MNKPDLLGAFACLADRYGGELGIAARNLESGESVMFNADAMFPTASVIKLPILVELFRQANANAISLDTRVELRTADQRGGSGILKDLDPGLRPTIRDLARLMIVVSDNTATNLIIDAVGGVAAVNVAMDDLGLDSIRLHSRIEFDRSGSDERRFAESSPRQMCDLAYAVAVRDAFGADVSEAVEAVLARQQYLNQVPRYLEVMPYADVLGSAPRITVANKTGFSVGIRGDAGIVRYPGGGFSYAVFSHESKDESFAPEADGDVVAGLVGKLLLTYWWPAKLGPAPVLSTAYEVS